MNGQLKIEQMYAFIALDTRDNTEGVVATMPLRGSMPLPMVGADIAMVEMLKPQAQEICNATGMEITICLFETRTEVEVLRPEPKK